MEKEKVSLLKALEDILVEVSWGRISEDYFGKSRSWLSKKMNGKAFNDNCTEDFTDKERETLENALFDLSERIRKSAEKL